jgi:hypothetical protein
MKLIKSALRNLLRQPALEKLMLLKIEGGNVEDFDFRAAVKIFFSKKLRLVQVEDKWKSGPASDYKWGDVSHPNPDRAAEADFEEAPLVPQLQPGLSNPVDVVARILTGKAPVDRQVKNKEKEAEKKAAQAERKRNNARRAKEAAEERKRKYNALSPAARAEYDIAKAAKRAKNAASSAKLRATPGVYMNPEDPAQIQLGRGSKRVSQPTIEGTSPAPRTCALEASRRTRAVGNRKPASAWLPASAGLPRRALTRPAQTAPELRCLTRHVGGSGALAYSRRSPWTGSGPVDARLSGTWSQH